MSRPSNQTGWIPRWITALLYPRNSVIEETGIAAGLLNHRQRRWRGWRTNLYDINRPGGYLDGSFTRGASIRASLSLYSGNADLINSAPVCVKNDEKCQELR